MTLDQEISASFSVLGLLIAVIAAYLAGVWPTVMRLKEKRIPDLPEERASDIRTCQSYRNAALVVLVAATVVVALILPLFVRVLGDVDIHEGFSTVRASAVVFELFAVASVLGVYQLVKSFNKQIDDIKKAPLP